MKNNVLNITTIYTMLVACATLMIACPEPDKPTTKTPTNTGPFTITFNLDGGTGNDSTNPQTIALDKKATKPKNDPTKDKSTFGLWYQDKKFTIPFFFDTPITQDISLYARWNKPNHFTVRFNPNGGSAVPEQIVALNGKATRPTPPPPPPKTNLTFGGWYTDNKLTTAFKFKFDTEKIIKNTILYARWKKPNEFTVTFDANDGSAIADQIIALDNKATKPDTPTKTGFAFVDWYTDSKLTIPFKFDTDKITKNIILYADWIFLCTAAAGVWHTLYIHTDGTLWAWGFNGTSQLGLGGPNTRTQPVQVGKAAWRTVSAGKNHSVGIHTDGTLWAWGWNSYGQVGVGAAGRDKGKGTPTKVDSDTWRMVSVGEDYSIGIKTDGTLWAWGWNNTSQLGLGDTNNRSSPTKVGEKTWKMVDAGDSHTVGIQTDGTLWAWGLNTEGKLGVGDTNIRTKPTQVGKATWRTVSVGALHSLGIQTDDTLWAWGQNDFWQLGTNKRDFDESSPKQIGSSKWHMVSAGTWYTIGIQTDGTRWAWGDNGGYRGGGDLGNGKSGKNQKETQPVQVDSYTWRMVDGGKEYHSLGIKTDDTLWTWGGNKYGQLGIGSTTNKSSTPVQVTVPPTTP